MILITIGGSIILVGLLVIDAPMWIVLPSAMFIGGLITFAFSDREE